MGDVCIGQFTFGHEYDHSIFGVGLFAVDTGEGGQVKGPMLASIGLGRLFAFF